MLAVDLGDRRPAQLHRLLADLERALFQIGGHVSLAERHLAVGVLEIGLGVLDEEGDFPGVRGVAVMPGEGRDGDLVVERDLLALLRRLHGERDADRLVAQAMDVVQGARPPGRTHLQRPDLLGGQPGRVAEVEDHLHVVVRLLVLAGRGDQPLFLGQVLDQRLDDILGRAVEQETERGQRLFDELEMVRHVDPECLERQRPVGHRLEERMFLGVPGFPEGDDLFADPGGGAVHIPASPLGRGDATPRGYARQSAGDVSS